MVLFCSGDVLWVKVVALGMVGRRGDLQCTVVVVGKGGECALIRKGLGM